MPRRIEIELTSAQADGTWTWRAAGARQPRGSLDGGLLPAQAKAGDVLRAEAEFEVEGITIVSVLAPREKKRAQPERIEVIGPPQSDAPSVTTQLASRADRRPGDRRPGDRRRERDDGAGDRAGDGDRPRPSGRDGAPSTPDGRPARRPERKPDRARPERPPIDASRAGRPLDGARAERPSRPPARGERATSGTHHPDERFRQRGQGRVDSRPVPAGAAPRSDTSGRGRRLNPGNTHRSAVMEALPSEQQPVAEQVLRGGIPAVRTAIHLEREKATAEGRAAPNADALLAIAEGLLPRLKAAEWRDRAEAAVKSVDDVALRDLRSLAAGADLARDDASRELAATLRAGLERRVTALRSEWIEEVTRHLNDGKIVHSLRLAARPPEPQSQIPSDLAERLSDVAGRAMAADTPPERWAALLDAVAESPVRRTVKPAALPSELPPGLLRTAHQQSGRVPALVSMLGIPMPPPPGPPRQIGGLGRAPGRPRPRRRLPPASERPPPEAGQAEPHPGWSGDAPPPPGGTADTQS